MSTQQQNPGPGRNISLIISVSVLRNTQPNAASLADIPPFSLGPSLYDFARTFSPTTTSMSSPSPPGSPPLDPIPLHHSFNAPSIESPPVQVEIRNAAQNHSVSLIADNQQIHSSDIMLHSIDSSAPPFNPLSTNFDSFEQPIAEAGSTTVSGSVQVPHVNTDFLPHHTTGKQLTDGTNSQSMHFVSGPMCKKHEKTGKYCSTKCPDISKPAQCLLETEGHRESAREYRRH